MKNLLLYILLTAVITTTLTAPAIASDATTRDGVFIHVSSGPEAPHRLLMALNMANMMAGDHDVLVYFDIDAVHAVLKDAAEVTYAHFPSLHTQLQALKAKGVTLMACPGCLKAAGKAADDLADGIQLADRSQFFSFTEGRILSLDY